jgi:hypothetical protein
MPRRGSDVPASIPRSLTGVTGSRHRREATTRTVAIGVALAVAFGAGVVALGLADGRGLRVAVMLVLAVAIGAAVLAMDEARITEAKVRAELSRERADRVRADLDADRRAGRLLARIDDLEARLVGAERELRKAPRTTVVVAPDRRPVARIIELPDAVPATGDVEAPGDGDTFVDVGPHETVIVLPDADADAEAASGRGAAPDDVLVVTDVDDAPTPEDDFPIVEVVGEFSLDGLAAFPRPAGMPAPDVIDLRERDAEVAEATDRTA